MSWPEIPEEPERIPQRAILVTLAAVVVAIGISVVVVLGGFTHDHHASSQTIRDVDLHQPPAQPFSDVRPPTVELDAWVWANRDARIVRMPVDVAIDHYLSRGAR